MRRTMLASTALILSMAGGAHAQTVIDAKRTDPVRTSTIKAGKPDAIRISSTGSVAPTGGAAVTIDSSNAVTNEGTIAISNADNASGIAAAANTAGGITNSGTITIDETYAATDTDKDGDLDGPFAVGRNRVGIATAGSYAGAIANSGTITVEGNDSAGIRLGGPLTGDLRNDGTISVTGDRAVGVDAAAINGNVRLAGKVTATGQGAVAARFAGDVTGAMVVQGAITATGYRYMSAPADSTKLDADDLLQGGPALSIEGNITGGIVLAVPPKDTDPKNNDEDKDGIDDAKEGSAAVTSYGAAPAMQIGAATRDITIGAVAGTGTGYGLIVDGAIAGNGVYTGVAGNGLVIGGRGGAVTIKGGIGVTGTIQATANGASATAIRLGAGASTPELSNAGTIAAAGGGTAASRSVAILVDAGASLPAIRNSGVVKAGASGVDGTAIGILDQSGTVALIENSGTIAASGAAATSDRNVAIDVSASKAGVTIRQTAVASGVAPPSISGDVRFGAGNDVLDVADGTVSGNATFGGGNNRLTLSGDAIFKGNASFGAGADTVALDGTSVLAGNLDFGGGADVLTLAGSSRLTGRLSNAGALAVTVGGGTLDLAGSNSIGSLSVGAKGVLAVTLDKAGGAGTFIQVAGNASFAKGATVAVRLASINQAEGRYVVLRAGSLTGAADLTADTMLLPFLYKGSIAANTGNDLAIDLTRKSVTELGLNRSQASAFNAIYAALGTDAKIGGAFLAITDGAVLRSSVQQLLPDHAGGVFEVLTVGSRALARHVSDPHGLFKDEGKWAWWLDTAGWGSSKSVGQTAGYEANGWGLSGGAEAKLGFGNVGLSLAYLNGRSNDKGTTNEVMANQYELAGYWRGHWGGFAANVRASAAKVNLDASRTFTGQTGSEAVERIARSDRHGDLASASGGVSYETGGKTTFLRPALSIDYYRLTEKGYAEKGGGTAIDLIVDRRVSDELALNATLAAGLDVFGSNTDVFGRTSDEGWFRIEAEGGRRELLAGSLGETTAHFAGGKDFTLEPEDRTSGWVGRVRALGGTRYFRVSGEAGGEKQQDHWALSLRASVQIGL